MEKNEYIKIDREVVKKMSEDIQVYLVENNLERVKTKDMMPFLIEKGYFAHDRKKGYPLRQILTDLKKSEEFNNKSAVSLSVPPPTKLNNSNTSISELYSNFSGSSLIIPFFAANIVFVLDILTLKFGTLD